MCAYALNIVGKIKKNLFNYFNYYFMSVINQKSFKFNFILGIKEVIYGCYNDRFGGNGSVLKLHEHIPNKYKSIG